jgi:hypothetical protein
MWLVIWKEFTYISDEFAAFIFKVRLEVLIYIPEDGIYFKLF